MHYPKLIAESPSLLAVKAATAALRATIGGTFNARGALITLSVWINALCSG
jgi:hypothetical protein